LLNKSTPFSQKKTTNPITPDEIPLSRIQSLYSRTAVIPELSMLSFFVLLAVLCAVAPAILFLFNTRRFQAPRFGKSEDVRVAVLIPARDEEPGIRACLEHVLASREADFHVFVLDDNSADRTSFIVQQMAATDARLDLLHSEPLPDGWNGKQFACWQLAQTTNAPLLLFLDADVHLDPWAIARSVATFRSSRVSLLSGFPRQITIGPLEWLLIPLIHFVLLGYLPLKRMRKTTDPAYAAGCGQFLLVDREAYFETGGHSAIRETRHDGLRLPQLFREHKLRTDIVDLTPLASVRMYDTPGAVWLGLAKNATEGLGSPTRIVPFTLLFALGQIAPFLLLFITAFTTLKLVLTHAAAPVLHIADPFFAALLTVASALAVFAAWLPRFIAAHKFKQPYKSAWLHPVGITLLLTIQWYAFIRQTIGRPVGWRARDYSTTTGAEV
jgi:hypothetical protein